MSSLAGGDPNNQWLIKKGDVLPDQTFGDFRGDSDNITTTWRTIWGEPSLYIFPLTGSQMTISSSSANDTALGTGQRTILLIFLDSNYIERQEIVTLNGQSGVNTVSTDVFRINGCFGVTAGSNSNNLGIIYVGIGSITAGKPATVYSHMQIGTGFAFNGVYTVPKDRFWSDLSLLISVESQKNVSLRISGFNAFGTGSYTVFFTAKSLINFTSVDLQYYNSVPGKLDLRVDAKTSIGDASCSFIYNFFQFKQRMLY